MSGPSVLHVVPHTHWDREWYLPFQSFRMRLVELMDGVLELLETDPRFAFTLDGQLAVVDDYLEIRPDAEARIRRLVGEGRLVMGPWQILMDEFLVSGESIVRNLELGWRRGEELGGAMPVGYLPDMFGHVAQMPQILRRAGISQAIVWRGVPAAVDRHAFVWEAPDGSTVRTEYLVGGYGNAAYLFESAETLPARVEEFREAVAPFFGDEPPLAMVGTDHMAPNPRLAELVEELNAGDDRHLLRIGTLADYFAGGEETPEGLLRWRGELRSGARANLLMGVVSARIDLKAACARAERMLERYAEPLQALYGTAWPEPYLTQAWSRVIQNSAHDSICGCSADAVCDQVLVRFAEAEQIAAGLAERAAEAVAAGAPRGSVAVFNPSPEPRSGLVELELPIRDGWDQVALALPDGQLLGTQEVGGPTPVLYEATVHGGLISEMISRRIHGRELLGRWLNGYELDESEGMRRLIVEVGDEADPAELDVEALKREIAAVAEQAPDVAWQVRIVAAPRRRLVAAVPAPALGWQVVRPVRGTGRVEHPVEAAPDGLRNGLVDVAVACDGTLRLEGGGVSAEGVARLVDGGDFGDSYNYAPPAADTLVGEPESVGVEVVAAGPVGAELAVTRTYRWPADLLGDGSARAPASSHVPVTMSVELRSGEPFVRLRVSFDNQCSDHRLRLHVPLPEAATSSFAEGQFAVVERPLEGEGGHGEVPLPTFPARGFVDAGGVAVLLDHVLEYELLAGRELALTVLRSVGLISRSANPYREEPAGPELPIPAAQCRGPWSVALAVYPHAGSWVDAGVLAQMERYQHPFLTAPGASDGMWETSGAGLEIAGEGVMLSSLRRRGEWLELRLLCEQPVPRAAVASSGFREAREADLLGRPGGVIGLESGVLRLNLRPWEIRTVQLRR